MSLDIKGTIWTMAGEYRLATGDPAFTIDVLGGARMFNMKNTLGWNFTGSGSHPLAGRSGSRSSTRRSGTPSSASRATTPSAPNGNGSSPSISTSAPASRT